MYVDSSLAQVKTKTDAGIYFKMAGRKLFWSSFICSICSFFCMFVAFVSPYWVKSWTRVHSPFSNVGLWHVCLAGYVKPRDPNLHSYVGCWWIHSTMFEDVTNDLMPPWFRGVQALAVFTILCNLVAMILIILYLPEVTRINVYGERKFTMFLISSILLGIAASFVFIDSLVFAQRSLDPKWMARPWMNYLSYSYGLNVLSGFFSAFGTIFTFLLAWVVKNQPKTQKIEDKGESFI